MSNRYKGGIISATPPTTTGGESGVASGAWTLEQQMQAQAAGLWPIQPPPPYIEDVFSTYLYTGNSSTQTITNGINLSGKGGLVWIKSRSAATNHALADSTMNLAAFDCLISNATNAKAGNGDLNAFNSNGFSLGYYAGSGNASGSTYASWTFRKQPKFFDIVTYSGNSVSGREISHNLGSVPGCIIVKCISNTTAWRVYHRSLVSTGSGVSAYLRLDSTAAVDQQTRCWGFTGQPTATTFGVGNDGDLNETGQSYVAYLFAHDAGGFGLTGTDNVISCGSYTGNGSATGPLVTLGYEPQWVMVKQSSASGQYWNMIDVMRGFDVSTGAQTLGANASDIEYTNAGFGSGTPIMSPTATGFQVRSAQPATNASGATYIYIAIRRGPMKVPTSGTSVFSPVVRTGTNAVASITGLGFAPDLAVIKFRSAAVDNVWYDRLRGPDLYLAASNTNAEVSYSPSVTSYNNAGITFGDDLAQGVVNANGISYINWLFGRAPSFFDEVCYTGNGTAARNITHNLTVAPEMIIVKGRTNTEQWPVWATSIAYGSNNYLSLASAVASGNTDVLNYNETTNTAVPPTSTTFTVGTHPRVNSSGTTYVAYVFATAAGVSKVGSYTGTGTTQTINCGFLTGARFVMIKRTDSTGDWYVWDSARGIIPSNDPYLLLNSTAAEVTGTDYVDTSSTGFDITSTAPAAINASGGTFIFLAIA
jgi:hypothetical protein